MLGKYTFLIPMMVGLILLIILIWSRRNRLKVKSLRQISGKGMMSRLVLAGEKFIVPSKKSKIYRVYEELLTYSKRTVSEFFTIKFLVVFISLLIIFLVHLTNVSIYTKEIFSKYEFQKDELFQQKIQGIDETKAFEEEINYLRLTIKQISKKDINVLSKEEIQGKILGLILQSNEDNQLPPINIANKVYHRLYHYYRVRNLNYSLIFVSLIMIYFLPDLFLAIYNYFILAKVRSELRFLKRLIILNGSIKPVNFMEVLSILIDKSKYHRKFLKEIENQNKKNTVSNSSIYRMYIEREKDINTKLFLEKLDQANNYDFEQAIVNIENEFNLEKRQRIRNVKKQIEVINAWGIVGCFLLIGLLTMYMLIPWLQAYNMNQMF